MNRAQPARIASFASVRVALACITFVGAACAAPKEATRLDAAMDQAARLLADSAFADSILRAAEDMGAVVETRESTLPAPVRDPTEIRLALQAYSFGTYIGELFAERDSVNYRWSERVREPLRVWIQRAPLGPREAEFPRTIEEAFDPWTKVGIPVAFQFIEDSARADVLITWVAQYESRTTGRTRWVHDQHGWIVGASIELALAQPDGRALDLPALRAVARHEVGHLLGLGHCADETNIMAATVRVTELSEADRATVRLVYKLPPGSVRAP